VWFTDPVFPPSPERRAGRLWRFRGGGIVELAADSFHFCNGIALAAGGSLVVVERRGVVRVASDGSRQWVIEDLGDGGGDGLCVDDEGRLYVAATTAHGVRVVEDGEVVGFLALPGEGFRPGAPVHRWRPPADASGMR
jgi:sugar lactone lactonase YvrE